MFLQLGFLFTRRVRAHWRRGELIGRFASIQICE
jgi:hypothetical protein